jgi:Raf kinase inhibitor-like YbhB/YbcL family protein
MKIESLEFAEGEAIPASYTCDGADINPPLEIEEVPEGAQSLVLIVDDPDAPTGIWVHWTLWNIDPKRTEIGAGEVPEEASQGQTSFGKSGYGGPCPGQGQHRYFFKLYALDMKLELPPETEAEQLEAALVGHVMAQAETVGVYERE